MINTIDKPEKNNQRIIRARHLLIILSLLYWIWLVFDLITHPLAPGPNEGGSLFRWLSALTCTGTLITALYTMRRVPDNPVGLLLFLWGIGASGWSLRSEWPYVPLGVVASTIFAITFFCISCPAVIVMFILFPDGEPYQPKLKRWMPLLFGLLAFSGIFYMAGYPATYKGGIHNPFHVSALQGIGITIYLVVFVIGMIIGLVSLVIRYRVGNERLRLQIRWLMWLLGVGIFFASFPFDAVIGALISTAISIISFLFWQGFPALGIGVAILRHNLWGIDVIIRRTLIWTVITGLLVLTYFGAIGILQLVFLRATDHNSTITIVVSTLATSLLINPIRHRVQGFIDKCFYRKKYDAEQAIAEFSVTMREAVDINDMTDRLHYIIEKSIQPESISLWIKRIDM